MCSNGIWCGKSLCERAQAQGFGSMRVGLRKKRKGSRERRVRLGLQALQTLALQFASAGGLESPTYGAHRNRNKIGNAHPPCAIHTIALRQPSESAELDTKCAPQVRISHSCHINGQLGVSHLGCPLPSKLDWGGASAVRNSHSCAVLAKQIGRIRY